MDKKASVSTLKELAKMYHGKESQAITDDELWHTNGVFMKGITTRKDLFIHAITMVPNELVSMQFFAELYGVMEFAYREKNIYIEDTLTLEEFCKTDFGMKKEDVSAMTSTYSMAYNYGFVITEEMFIDSIDKLAKKKKQGLYRDIISRSTKAYKNGDVDGADKLIHQYITESNVLKERNKPVKLSVLSETAIDRYNHKQDTIIKTGISHFDHLTGGGRKGHTWIIAGYTGDGKSTCCANMAYNAMIDNRVVLWVTLELPMSDMQTIFEARHAKAIGFGKTVTFDKIDQRKFTPQEFKDYQAVVEDLKKYDNLILHEPEHGFTIENLTDEIDRIKAVRNLDMVVVDYLELIDPSPDMKYDQYRIRIKRMMRDARLLARRKNILMVVPHQISRSGRASAEERSKEDVPYYELSDLQESSGVEQNCAVMAWIYQDQFLRGKSMARLGISKNTKGPINIKGWDIAIDFAHREIDTSFVPRS